MIEGIFLFLVSGVSASSPLPPAEQTTDSVTTSELKELVVTGQSARQRISENRLGAEKLDLSQLVQLPSFAGENDIIKAIALLPGVHGEGDGAGGFEVRGGNASQNLVLLDGISLFNPSHVMGIFSTFNDQAIGRATLFKGPIPAIYGGATSSVLETSLKPGDMNSYHGSLSVGILAAKIMAEGPIVRDRLSFAVTARRSYVDAFLKIIPQYRTTVMNFYDVTAKLRWHPSAAHLIDGSFFISHDNMAVGNIMGLYWGNLGASLNWNARISDKVSSTATGSFTHFSPKMSMDLMDVEQVMRTYIHTYSLNERLSFSLNDNHSIETGIRSELFRVKSAEWEYAPAREIEIRSLWSNAMWVDYSGRFSSIFEVSGGIRVDLASVLSQRRFHQLIAANPSSPSPRGKTYVHLQPRFNVKFNLSEYQNIKAGVGVATQNLHELRSSSTSFPFHRYAHTSSEVKPECALQYGAGYSGMTPSGNFDWSVEGYYKQIENVYDYKDGRSSFSNIDLESIILGGKGRSYGVEFMVRKNLGKLTGWIGYTLSRTETKIPGINDGEWYDATNDRRHDLSVTANYHFSDKWSMSGSWIYSSGQPLTAPDVKYEIAGETCYYYSRRNSYHTPSTHRLDLSATYTHVGKRFTYEWSFGVYNAYCRYNPYVVYFEDDPTKPSGTRAVQQSLFGVIPSVTYTLKF